MREKFALLSLLPSHLRVSSGSSVTEHCDPEALTAFAEQTLHAGEREQVARHLSLCPECREVLALSSVADIPALNSESRPANTRRQWLYSAPVLTALCLAVLLFPSTKPPAPLPVQKTSAPNRTFTPQLSGARLVAPVLPGLSPVWRVNASRYPASLEVSYDKRRTWRAVHPPNLRPKAVASEGTNVWVVNADGTVLQSNDDGLHWTPLRPTVHLSAVEASANR